MVSVCFYFQVHQPIRLRKYSIFEIGKHANYFDDRKNEEIIKKIEKIAKTDKAGAAKMLNVAFQAIDKSAQKGVIKKNNASRRKSRIAKMVEKASK